ncbi:MAG TPA: RlpA-like double-psi beta-barrel domain-containing protein [Candidatus Limnocylindrales bacterium]|nr:RlpA-like double-psi beta-barrel domain-containing protein [Candidatus Limnocylindrales bacterium]
MKRALAILAFLVFAQPVEAAVVGGTASYYDDGPGLYAAVPSYSFGDPRYDLKVCRQDTNACVTVTVRDHCNCYVGTDHARAIDLSPEAFSQLAPLSRGLIPVYFQTAAPDEVTLTPPPTDTVVGSGTVRCSIPI